MSAKLGRIMVSVTILVLAGSALAQETTGHLEGIVVDERGSPVPDTDVIATGASLQGARHAAADSRGLFTLIELPVGAYRVEISRVGYRGVTYDGVQIRLGKTTSLGKTRLVPEAQELPPLLISAPEPTIDPYSTVLGFNFLAEDYEVLPTERDYRSIATLMPHANESFLGDEVNFAGSTGHENKYFVDGVEVTNGYTAHTGMPLPYNFVEETQIRAGGYEAEHRSSLGGIMDVITPSGSNEFHGQIFGFFVNDRLTGNATRSALDPPAGDFAAYDIGFSLGGPVVRDRLWFYAAYDPTVFDEDVDVPGHGFYGDKTTEHRFAGKLSWRASDRTSLTFSTAGNPLDRDAVAGWGVMGTPLVLENPDPYLGNIESRDFSMALNAEHFVNDDFFIDVQASRFHDSFSFEPSTERGRNEVFFIDRETSTWSGGCRSTVDLSDVVSIVQTSGTRVSGNHTFKAGAAYKDAKLDYDETWVLLARYADDLFIQFEWIATGWVANRIPSAFIQDSWQIQPRWRINAGLRWDGQYLVGSDGQVAQGITDQWQPRLGVTYQPGELGKQKIFGSYGRFYQELSTAVVQAYYSTKVADRYIEYDHDPRVDPTGGVVTDFASDIQYEIDDMEGQFYDEVSLGYEREIRAGTKLGVRGAHRWLGQALEDGWDPETGDYEFNNPGRGHLSAFPEAKREYTGIEISYRQFLGDRLAFWTSYVWSRTHGNYPGLYGSDMRINYPNYSTMFDDLITMENATGRLPNDRPHVFKLAGSYRTAFGLSSGLTFSWMSGTPLSEWGGTELGPPVYQFIGYRGSAGRTPSIWDLNLRFTYTMRSWWQGRWRQRLILDLLHVASQERPVDFFQQHYYAVDEDGNQTDPNPTYGMPFQFQPPMAVRLGVEVTF